MCASVCTVSIAKSKCIMLFIIIHNFHKYFKSGIILYKARAHKKLSMVLILKGSVCAGCALEISDLLSQIY